MEDLIVIRFTHIAFLMAFSEFIGVNVVLMEKGDITEIRMKKSANTFESVSFKADAQYVKLINERDIEMHVDGIPVSIIRRKKETNKG